MCGLAIISGCQKDELENIPDGAIMLTAEGFHGDGSKTSVRGNTVQWVNNDQVKFNNADPVYVIVTGDDKAYVSSVPSTNPLYAYYPADLAVGTYQSDNTNITLPAEYTSSYDGYRNQELHLPMVAKVTGANPSTIEFKHLTAAVKVTVKNMAGVDVTLDSVVITSNSLQFSGTRSVTIGEGSVSVAAQAAGTPALADRRVRVSFSESPIISSGATKEVQVPFWPVAATTGTGDFTINVYTHNGSDQYYLHKNGTSPELARNELLTANVSIGNNVIDLSGVSENITVENGKILTGTLAKNVKISIADGATVTLSGVNINGSGTWTYGSYAGINCLGDATIILADGITNTVKGFNSNYPGIYVPSGKTLTIQGTGSLNASSNGYGAGIGAGWSISCGNIAINGGTITAMGGSNGAGIGCGNGASCGTISITGGTITATGGGNAAGIGSSWNNSCGTITISGGTVSATGGSSGAGIGSGANYSSCGNITISGGTVEATGGSYAAGIGGGGSASSCSDITILNTVTIVTATKGSGATNNIGKGSNSGTCGTISFGDATVYNGSWSPNPMVAGNYGGLTLAISTTTSTDDTWTLTPTPAPSIPEGAIDGKFTINSIGDQVYFSQGNLQYQASTSTWRFAEHQWDFVGDATYGNVYVGEVKSNNASISSSYTGWIDLFGWGTSGWDCGNTYYRPWDSNNSSSRYYGPNGQYYNLTDSYANSDWGYYNAISNGGNQSHQWRTLTKDEWTYLCGTRTTGGTVFGTSQARYTEATINTDGTGVNGIILFPDGVDIASSEVTTAGTVNSASNWTTKCTTAQWTALEAKGCVFLPAAGYRNGTSVYSVNSYVCYWSSSYSSNGYYNAYYVRILSNTVDLQSSGERFKGSSVRLARVVE